MKKNNYYFIHKNKKPKKLKLKIVSVISSQSCVNHFKIAIQQFENFTQALIKLAKVT